MPVFSLILSGAHLFLLQPKELRPAQSITSSSDVTITSRSASFNVMLARLPLQHKATAFYRFASFWSERSLIHIFCLNESVWNFALRSGFIIKTIVQNVLTFPTYHGKSWYCTETKRGLCSSSLSKKSEIIHTQFLKSTSQLDHLCVFLAVINVCLRLCVPARGRPRRWRLCRHGWREWAGLWGVRVGGAEEDPCHGFAGGRFQR